MKHMLFIAAIIISISIKPGTAQTWHRVSIGTFAGYSPMLVVDNDGYLHLGDAYQYTNTYAQDPAALSSGSHNNFKVELPSDAGSYFPAMRYKNGMPHICWRIYTSSDMGVAYWNPLLDDSYEFYLNDGHAHYPSLEISEDGTKHFWLQIDSDPTGVNIFYENSNSASQQKMIANGWDEGRGGLYDYTTVMDLNGDMHWMGSVYRPEIGPAKRMYHNYSTGGNFQDSATLINHVGYFPSMAVDSDNNIHAVWQNGVIEYTMFNGTSWSEPITISDPGENAPQYVVYQQVNDQNMTSMRPIKNNLSWAWTCGDGGIFMTNDKWEHFDIQYVDGSGYRGIFPVDTLYGYCVGENGKFWRTQSGGLVLPSGADGWEEDNTGFPNNLNDCWFTDTITGYAFGQSGIILKTTDKGDTWTQIIHGLTTRALRYSHFPSDSIGYVVGGGGVVLKTTDAGNTWSDISIDETKILYAVYAISNDTVWVGGESNTLRVSYDGGATWSLNMDYNMGTMSNIYSIWFVNDTLGFVTGTRVGSDESDYLHLFKTTDGGNLWSSTKPLTGNNEDMYIEGLYFHDEDMGFAIGGQGKIYRGIMATDAEYYQPGIKVDQNGFLHVAYWGWSDQYHSDRYTYYVNNVGGTWNEQQLIATSCYTGQTDGGSKIALDFNTNTIYVGTLSGSSSLSGNLIYTRDINIRNTSLTGDFSTTISSSPALTEPSLFSLDYNSESNLLSVFDFDIDDAGNDGNSTQITQLTIRKGPEGSQSLNYNNVLGGAWLCYNSDSIAADSIGNDFIQFGNDLSTLLNVPDATSLTLTLKTYLNSNGTFNDGDAFDFKISPCHDIHIDTNGSEMIITPTDITSGDIAISLKPSYFEFSGLPTHIVYNSDFTFTDDFSVTALDTNNRITVTAACADLQLEAVLTDSTTAISGTMSTDPSGNQSLTEGVANYSTLNFSEGYQTVRIKASGTINGETITGYSDTIVILPQNDILLIYHSNTNEFTTPFLSPSLNRLGIGHDVINNQYDYSKIIPLDFLENYKTVFIHEPNANSKDTTNLKTYLQNANSSSKRNMGIFGYLFYGVSGGEPRLGGFGDYFGVGTRTIYPYDEGLHNTDSIITGTTGDPIGNGITSYFNFNIHYDEVMTLCPIKDSVNTRVVLSSTLGESYDYPLPIALRHQGTNYKTFRSGFYLDNFGSEELLDTLFKRILNWFDTPYTDNYGHTPYFENNLAVSAQTLTIINEDEAFHVNIGYNDLDGDALTASAVVLPAWLNTTVYNDSIIVSGTPDNNAVGDTTFLIKIEDVQGNYTLQTTRLRISHVNHAPTLNIDLPDSAQVGRTYEYTVIANDIDTLVGDELSYSLSDASDMWLNLSTAGLLSGTPSLSDTGTYSARIIAEDSSGDTVSQIIQIEVYVDTVPPTIAFSESSLSFSVPQGLGESQELTISNNGDLTLNWSASKTESWLSINTVSGSLEALNSETINIGTDATGLSEGNYTDSIVVSANDPSTPTSYIAVTLAVEPGSPLAEFSVENVAYYIANGEDVVDSIIIKNKGSANLDCSIPSTPSNMVISSNFETVVPGDSVTFTYWWYTNSYANNTYYDTLHFFTNDNTQAEVDIPMLLTIADGYPEINLSTAGFDANIAESASSSETLSIENTGTSNLNWSITNTESWLSPASTSGSVNSSDTYNLTLNLNSASLSTGYYYDTLVISSDDPDEGTLHIPFRLNVMQAGPAASYSPTSLTYNINPGVEIVDSVVVENIGTSTLEFSIPSTPPDMVINSNYEYIDPGNSYTFKFWWYVHTYPEDTYLDTLNFFSNDPAHTTINIPMELTISSGGPEIDISPMSVSISLNEDESESEIIRIMNIGSQALNWSATNNEPWLSITNNTTSVPAGNEGSIDLELTSAGLISAGEYFDTIAISSNDPSASLLKVPVSMNVLGEMMLVYPDTVPVALAPGAIGQAMYVIKNIGSTSYNWMAGNLFTSPWLSVDNNSGSLNPGDSVIINVTINTGTLGTNTVEYGTCFADSPDPLISPTDVVFKVSISDDTPAVEPDVTIGTLNNAYCSGSSFMVNYTIIDGSFASNNVFNVELSSETGSFSSPEVIGLINANSNGSIPVQIPLGTPAGANYRMRITASEPTVTGDNNGSDIEIISKPTATIDNAISICENETEVSLPSGNPAGGVYEGVGVASNGIFTPSLAGTGIHEYDYIYEIVPECSDTATGAIEVLSIPEKPLISLISNNELQSSSVSGNQWYLNNELIETATHQNYVLIEEGSYTVTVTINGCTSNSSDAYIHQVNALNLSETDIRDVLNIYPIPFDNTLHIITHNDIRKFSFRLFDVNGQIVFKSNILYDLTKEAVYDFDMNNLNKGNYFMILSIDDQEHIIRLSK